MVSRFQKAKEIIFFFFYKTSPHYLASEVLIIHFYMRRYFEWSNVNVTSTKYVSIYQSSFAWRFNTEISLNNKCLRARDHGY